MKFRKKPVVIEAVQFTLALRDAVVLGEAVAPYGIKCVSSSYHPGRREVHSAKFVVKTLEGDMEVSVDDWIIKGVKGETYPCKPDIFEATYEPAEGPSEDFLAGMRVGIREKQQV